MRSSGRFAINNLWALQVGAFLSLSLILIVFERQWYPALLLPVVALAAVFIIFVPQTILYVYLGSLFWGKFLLVKSFVAITLTDVVVPVLVLSYLGGFARSRIDLQSIKMPRSIWFPFLGLFLWSILSFLSNFHSYESTFVMVTVWYLSRFLQLGIIYVIFSDRRVSISLPLVINVFLVFFALQLPLAVVQYAVSAGLPYELRRMSVIGTLSYHHAMLGTSSLIPLALCLARFLQTSRIVEKFFYALLGVIFLMTIFISGARSPLMGIVLAGLVFLLMKFRLRLRHVVYLGLALVAGALLVTFSPLNSVVALTFSSSQYGGAFDASSMSRFLIWKGAVDHFLNADIWTKLVGVGVGAYPTVKYNFVMWSGQKMAVGAHNGFLHVLTEAGVIGLLLFSGLFWGILTTLSRRMRGDKLAFAFFFLTIALLGSSLTQETFWFQKSLATLWIMYMMLLALILRQPDSPQPTGAEVSESFQPSIYISPQGAVGDRKPGIESEAV